MGFFRSIKDSLVKTRENIVTKVQTIISTKKKIDEDTLNDLEEILIAADIGMEPSNEIIEILKERIKKQGYIEIEDVYSALRTVVGEFTGEGRDFFNPDLFPEKPFVIMVVGVNGVGKTTTIGKMANRFKENGAKVLISASDTFRAAAIEQLCIWADRASVEVVKHKSGADPAAVTYDAISAAVSRGMDVVIIDTAGRLHTKVNLIEELKKVVRVCKKVMPNAPHEVLLVIDAVTGQNGLTQARVFKDDIGATGIILAKLDGTAKGGITLSIKRQLDLPVVLIGTGEGLDDLREFNPIEYANGMIPSPSEDSTEDEKEE